MLTYADPQEARARVCARVVVVVETSDVLSIGEVCVGVWVGVGVQVLVLLHNRFTIRRVLHLCPHTDDLLHRSC